jgi:hypothetical protein
MSTGVACVMLIDVPRVGVEFRNVASPSLLVVCSKAFEALHGIF